MPLSEGIALFDLPDVHDQDFAGHNRESVALWKAFGERTHERIPVRFTCNPRILMLDPQYNTRGISYEKYMGEPEIMAQALLEFRYWTRFLLPGDHEKGLPEKWSVNIDFENHYDAAWFGCPVHYREGQVPDTTPILDDDHKNMLFDRGAPEPFAGEWPERCLRYLDTFRKWQQEGWTFLGRPVVVDPWTPFMGCDGVFTAATSLRGATAMCLDLLMDSEYAHELLEYVHAAVTSRMRAWREQAGVPIPQENFCAADDGIEALSTGHYDEFVFRLHRRLYDEFGAPANRGIHLCGNAQRHFAMIRDGLGVTSFDTGFPVDFKKLREDLGPDVLVSGGPRISFFLEDTSGPMLAETERILRSGILEGGRFILQEANNLPPRARLHVCQDFYEMGKRLGRLVDP